MQIKSALVLAIFSLATFAACKKDNALITYDCVGTTPTYTADVKVILDTHCATSNCHSAARKADGKDYSSYNAVKSGASNAAFLGSMQHISGYKSMPQGAAQLSEVNLKTISCWVENGTPE